MFRDLETWKVHSSGTESQNLGATEAVNGTPAAPPGTTAAQGATVAANDRPAVTAVTVGEVVDLESDRDLMKRRMGVAGY